MRKRLQNTIKRLKILALLAVYLFTALGIASIPMGSAKAAQPPAGDTSSDGALFGITADTDPKDVTYTAEWLDAAHLKVKIGIKGVYSDNFVMFEPENDTGGSSPLVDQVNDAHDTLNMVVNGWGAGHCYAHAWTEVDADNIIYHTIRHIGIDIDFTIDRTKGCEKDLGGLVGVDTINPEMSTAYFRWVDSVTIEPVDVDDQGRGMHIDQAGGVDIDDTRNISPEFKHYTGEPAELFYDTKEYPSGFCVDTMKVSADRKTLKFYDFFDKKEYDSSWLSIDTLSIFDGASFLSTTDVVGSCAMQEHRSLEGFGFDDITIPYFDRDTNIANFADSTKPGTEGETIDGGLTPSGEGADEPNCDNQGGGLAWLVCTILTSIDSAVSWLEARIKDFLFINPQQFDKDNGAISNGKSQNGVYKAWSTLRGLSTVIIVIIALLMIFSEAMGQGIFDNYSVKKLLPKLIFAGIAVQLSWWLMTTLINVANIVGDGIGNLILNPFGLNSETLYDVIEKTGHTRPADNALLTGMVVVGAVAMLFMALGLGIGMLSAVFVALITLIFRNLVIYLGLVFAPIAIALSVLPGTQKASKWWWESFEKALMMYPIVVGLLAAGKIMSFLLLSGSSVSSNSVDKAVTSLNSVYVIGGVIAWYAPYFVLPKAFQLGGKALGKISGLAGDKSKGVFDKMRKKREDMRNNRRGKIANMYTPGGNMFKNAAARIGSGSLTKRAALQKGGQYYSGDLKKAQEELFAINRIADPGKKSKALQDMALRRNPRVAQAAMEQMLKTGDIKGLRQVMNDRSVDQTALTTFRNANFSDLKAKAVDLAIPKDPSTGKTKTSADFQVDFSKMSTGEILGQDKSTVKTHTGDGKAGGVTDPSLMSRAHASMTDGDQWKNLGTDHKARLLFLEGSSGLALEDLEKKSHTELDGLRSGLAGISDIRLKRSISYLGKVNDLKIYSYQYLWSPTYYVGVMAQDLLETHPGAVSTDSFGYYHVDYSQLGIRLETLYEWQKHNKYPTNSKTKVRVRS